MSSAQPKRLLKGWRPMPQISLKAYSDNVPKIAQQLRARAYPAFPQERMAEFLKEKAGPTIKSPVSPHSVLASLNLPVWITTAYDDLIERALIDRQIAPEVRLCRWKSFGPYRNQIKLPGRKGKAPKPVTNPFSEFQDESKRLSSVFTISTVTMTGRKPWSLPRTIISSSLPGRRSKLIALRPRTR